MDRRDATALAAVGVLAAVTISWWALALWPVPQADAAWLTRLRFVCFGVRQSGLPDASGWLVLTLQPALMFGVLFAVWGPNIRRGVMSMRQNRNGRIATAFLSATGIALVGAGVVRVVQASIDANLDFSVGNELLPDTYPRLDRPAPPFELVDQFGETVGLAKFQGRPVLITFAFGHCQTICPVVVHDAKQVRQRLASLDPAILVVSLDPWRDTPQRLRFLAEQWGLEAGEFALSGDVEQVEALLDEWNVARSRDELTGDITHPRLFFILSPSGEIAYAASGGVDALVELVERSLHAPS